MSCEQKTLVKTNRDSALPNAGLGEPPALENSMSYAMIVIGGGVGTLAAAIYSAVAYGLRALAAQAPLRERRLPDAYSQRG